MLFSFLTSLKPALDIITDTKLKYVIDILDILDNIDQIEIIIICISDNIYIIDVIFILDIIETSIDIINDEEINDLRCFSCGENWDGPLL